MTLCSFAPKPGEGTADHPAHGGSLRAALGAMHAAAMEAAPDPQQRRWTLQCAPTFKPSAAGHGLCLDFPAGSRTLTLICEAARASGLQRARRPQDLHLSIGAEAADLAGALCEELARCERWELVIAKCAGVLPGRRMAVSKFREVAPLEW